MKPPASKTKLIAYLCQKLRLPETANIFTIKTPSFIVKMSFKKLSLNCVWKRKIIAGKNETNVSNTDAQLWLVV